MLSVRTQRDEAMSANVGQTIRQPSTALLTIDSEDRWANWTQKRNAVPGSYNYSPYDFTITKNESIMNGFFTRLGVSEVVFPWTIPNINAQTNRMIVRYTSGGPVTRFTLSVPGGFYTPNELAAKIQAILIATDPLFAGTGVGYGFDLIGGSGAPTPVFSFDFSLTPLTVAFEPMPYQPNPALPDFFQFNNTKQLFDILGLSLNPLITTFTTRKQGFSTYCQSTRYIDIVCEVLTYNQALKDTTTQVVARDSLARVYLGAMNSNQNLQVNDPDFAPPGTTPGTIYAMYNNPKQIQWIPNQPVPSGLRFQIFDDEGTPLDDLFGAIGASPEINWSATILVSEN